MNKQDQDTTTEQQTVQQFNSNVQIPIYLLYAHWFSVRCEQFNVYLRATVCQRQVD